MAEYKQRVGIRQVDTRTGAASALRTLGDRLAQWQGDTGQFVQQQVSESIQKHRKSMIDGYDAGLNRDLREGLTRISSENPNNHEAYQQKAQAFVESTLGEIDEGYRGNFEEKSYALMDNYGNQVLKNNIALDRSNIKQSLSSSMETFKNDALRLAGQGDEESILEAAQAGVDFNTAANAMVNAGFITQDQADSEMKDLAKSSAEENFIGQVDSALEISIDSAKEVLAGMEAKVPGGWSPKEWEQVKNRARTSVNRAKSRITAEKKVAVAQLGQDVRTYAKAKENGINLDPKEERRIKSAAADNPGLMEILNNADELASFSVLSIDERNKIIAESDTGTAKDARTAMALSGQNATIKKAYIDDGYAMGVKQGLIEPVSLNEPDSFSIRDTQAQELSITQGVQVSPFTKGEVDVISGNISNNTVEANLNLISQIQTMSESSRSAAFEQLAGKAQTVFAVVGSIGDPSIAREALIGKEILDEGVTPKLKQSDYFSTFNEFVSDVYNAEDSRANLETALSIYAYRFKGEDFDASDFEDVLESVTGGIGTFNGKSYELPRNTGEDVFEDYIDNFSEEGFQAMGGAMGYTYDQFMETIDDGNLKSIGSNQYIVIDANFDSAVLREDGQPFVFSYDPAYIKEKQSNRRTRGRR